MRLGSRKHFMFFYADSELFPFEVNEFSFKFLKTSSDGRNSEFLSSDVSARNAAAGNAATR